jgi:hypothetical protein
MQHSRHSAWAFQLTIYGEFGSLRMGDDEVELQLPDMSEKKQFGKQILAIGV